MAKIKVKITKINYSIDEKDFDDYQEYYYTKESLPKEMVLEFQFNENEQDLDDVIVNLISDKTGWLVADFDYQIIK